MTSSALPPAGDGPACVVVGVDGSDTSLRAASYATGLARRRGCTLVWIFVRQSNGLAQHEPQAAAAYEQAHDASLLKLKEALSNANGGHELAGSLEVRFGEPAREIARLADQLRADAVVVGCSGSPGYHRFGSTAVKLVRAGRWPVTVVP